jgi:hypothetical protein
MTGTQKIWPLFVPREVVKHDNTYAYIPNVPLLHSKL